MTKRDRLLKVARGIKGVILSDENAWMDCLEVGVANATGSKLLSIQDGSTGVTGPYRIKATWHRKLNRLLANDEPLDDAEDDWDGGGSKTELEFSDAVEMVNARCKAGTDYYMLRDGPDTSFSVSKARLLREWKASLLMCADELEPWEDMEEEDLKERLKFFGLVDAGE